MIEIQLHSLRRAQEGTEGETYYGLSFNTHEKGPHTPLSDRNVAKRRYITSKILKTTT